MTESRKGIRTLLAIFGVVVLLATTVITLGTARPTEATWQDTVTGAASFGVGNPNEGNQFARALSTFGYVDRSSHDHDVGPVRADRQSPDKAQITDGPSPHRSSGAWGFLPLTTVGYSCATLNASDESCPSGGVGTVSDPIANATAETRSLSLTTASLGWLDLVTYEYENPIRATATCSPVESRASLGWDGPLLLGRGNNEVSVSLPDPNTETTGERRWGVYTYTATLQHVRKESRGYALSQLRLRVDTTGTADNDRWSLNLILAHAECGIDQATTEAPDRPTPNNWSPLARQTNRVSAANTDAPASLQPIVAQVDDELSKDAEVTEDETGREVNADRDDESLPTLDDVANAQRTDEEEAASDSEKVTSVTSPSITPATAAPTTADTEPDAPEPTTSAVESGIAEPTSSARPEQIGSPELQTGPQQPQDVRIGREFTVITREGVELGAARIEDVTRTPDCGVEITLNITTSNEDGPDRWASIDHRDFAEVRPSGSTRPAQRAGSECASSAASGRPAELRVAGVHEVVVVIQVSDTAQRAMFRPEGTAGWRFDLPPLPTTTATSTPATSSPPPTTPATSQASAPPQDTAVISEP